MPAPVVVAEIVRSGFVEGHHYGSVVALAADGSVDWSVGEVEQAILPRSCNKPLQAVGMLRAGLDLDGELLSLAAASHSGEDIHLDGVRRILAGAGLDESALQTPPDYPIDEEAREDYIRAGNHKSSIAMNCSGKHAAMLATCVANGWDTATYLDAAHPLQVAIAETFSDLTGEPVEAVTVDGCGAPLLSASLTGLARGFRAIPPATAGPPPPGGGAVPAGPGGTPRAPGGGGDPGVPGVHLRHPPGRGRAAPRRTRCDRQGRRGVLLCGRPGRRPRGRDQDRRRRRPGPAGADGRGAGSDGGHR